MRRLRLRRLVTYTGHDFWGKECTVVFEPLPDNDDRWLFGEKGALEITPQLFGLGMRGRTVGLYHKGRLLCLEFEHLAIFHLLGLRGVRVIIKGSNRPPYLCAAALWERITEALCDSAGTLQPWNAAHTMVFGEGRLRREASYTPVEKGVVIRAHVAYPQGKASRMLVLKDGEILPSDVKHVLAARTHARPAWLRPLAWALEGLGVWLHEDKVLWMSKHPEQAFFDELALHKLQDAGLPSFFTPEGCYVAGDYNYRASNHALDLKMIGRVGKAHGMHFSKAA